jgi:hypothetical protein
MDDPLSLETGDRVLAHRADMAEERYPGTSSEPPEGPIP